LVPCSVPPGLSNVVAIATGDYHSIALRSDGTVVAWGLNTSGQCDVPAGLKNVRAIAARGNHSMVLMKTSGK
jgi:trimeric autotransporter adhesin